MDIWFNKHYYTHLNGYAYDFAIIPSLTLSRNERTSDCKRTYFLTIHWLFWSTTFHWYKS